MGWGDEIMGSGIARSLAIPGKRIAFGAGGKIIWSPQAVEIYRHNRNVAPPGAEKASDLIWVPYYKGHRQYGTFKDGVWTWRPFHPVPGEIHLTSLEILAASKLMPAGSILIEPNVKPQSPNKQWGFERWQTVADELFVAGHQLVQFSFSKPTLKGVTEIFAEDFRTAAACVSMAGLYLGNEGGLHHVAAAFGRPAVVVFGGFISSAVTGYSFHTNIEVTSHHNRGLGCGNVRECQHCREVMASIPPSYVIEKVISHEKYRRRLASRQ